MKLRRPRPFAGLTDYVVSEAQKLPIAADPAVASFFARRINVFFVCVGLIMFAISWPTMGQTHDVMLVLRPVLAAFVAFPIALAWANPLLGWGISIVSANLIYALFDRVNGWDFGIQVPHIIEILVLTVFASLRGPLRLVPVVWAGSAATMYLVSPPPADDGWAFGITVAVVISLLVRVIFRSRRQLKVETELKEAVSSENAILAERTRIARDLHDVVAHKMSVVVVQSQTAKYRIPEVSDSAAAEFDAIAGVARDALDEVRAMLGVLRLEDEQVKAAPNPGIADIDAVVAATLGAGVDIEYRRGLGWEEVGESTGLVAYRIAQESLANATRYAPGAKVVVELTPINGRLALSVTNTAATSAPIALDHGGGNGIPGMIERAQAVGGTLSAEPTPHGGFAVHADLPFKPVTAGIAEAGADASSPATP